MNGVIYEPKGRALEYAPLALNVYNGCSHGCLYCYAPGAMHKDRAAFQATVKPRADLLERLAAEVHKYRGTDKHVHLCFSCDPYQPAEAEHKLTRAVICMLADNDVPFQILSKAGALPLRDLDIMRSARCRYGATLTFTDPANEAEWEPGACSNAERIETLTAMHAAGVETWASIEPVIDPEQSLEIIRRHCDIVDLWKIGRWNHDARANKIDWAAFRNRAREILEANRAKYIFKRDLLPAPLRARRG